MRKLMLRMQVSLDGCVGRADGDVEWAFPHFDEELVPHMVETLRGASAHLMGSATYRDMAAHWPHSDEPYAAPMNEIPKVVFSATPFTPEWQETRVLSGFDLKAQVEQLKRAPSARGDDDDGYLLAHGGASFARSLIGAGLVDAYELIIHPVALGNDALRIFDSPLDLRLTGARAFPAGAVVASYEPAR
jgi:dihydrofolate reductase